MHTRFYHRAVASLCASFTGAMKTRGARYWPFFVRSCGIRSQGATPFSSRKDRACTAEADLDGHATAIEELVLIWSASEAAEAAHVT
jgi:hypothetical protein